MIRFAMAARYACCGLLGLAILSPAHGQSRAPEPDPCAILHVRLAGTPEDAPLKTLLLRGGRIEAVLPDGSQVPGIFRQIDGTGLTAAPAFVDAFSQRGVVVPEIEAQQDRPVDTGGSVLTDMRVANRKGVNPGFRAADGLELTDEQADSMRKAGFGVMLAAPSGELMAGQSAVVLARNAAARDQVIRPVVFQHAAFDASGQGYPSTLMGYMAALRQLFLDAQHHGNLRARYASGLSGPRPPYDLVLEAVVPVLEGKQHLVCEAESDRDVRRWLRLADEFGFKPAIAGGRDAWQAADRLIAANVPVVLTLDWGDEVEDPEKAEEPEEEAEVEPEEEGAEDDPDTEEEADGTEEDESEADAAEEATTVEPLDFDYSEPMAVQLEKRAEWLRRRDCALRLAEAGVPIAFGSGSESSKELLERVRTLVKEGLSEQQALAALTTVGAELLGVTAEVGSIEAGRSATLCLWTASPFDEKSQVRWAFVDGFHHEYEAKEALGGEGPAEGVDLSGAWTLRDPDATDDPPMLLTLEMEDDGAVTGSVKATNPMDGSELASTVSGAVGGKEFELDMSFTVGDMQVDLTLSGKWNKDQLKGTQTVRFGGQEQDSKFVGTKSDDAKNQEVQR